MKGKPVGDICARCKAQSSVFISKNPTKTDLVSPKQKRTVTIIAKPVTPLSSIVMTIALGTFKAAFSISSDI